VEVVQLSWPTDEARRAELRAAAIPRLLLVDAHTPPPVASDGLEDWIRVPADEVDLRARIAALELRSAVQDRVEPLVDDDGVLHVGADWVALSPVEAQLVSALLTRFGAVVSRDSLSRAAWPDGAPGGNALDAHLVRLRRRVASVGLAIRTVRSRGFVLDASPEVAFADRRVRRHAVR
jgi:DNA-binding response OmpR family regulator